MNALFATVVGFALATGGPSWMEPRVLMGDSSHCDALMVRDGRIVVEEVCIRPSGPPENPFRAQVGWGGQVATISNADEKASAEWISAHSLLLRLSVQDHDLYWDGKKVDLGKVNVIRLYQAIPWQGGVLIYGRTIPRKGFFGSWPFKGHFIEDRDIDPFCAIFFYPNTLRGETAWLNGLAFRGFFVFPIPD